MKKILALNVNGDITYCTCPSELRGYGRCNHVAHQMEGETPEMFVSRISVNEASNGSIDALKNSKEITQEEIDNLAKRVDEIAGCHVTTENLRDVLKGLPADKIAEISKIGFNAAPVFSLPIREERYEDENVKNKLYFANLYKYGAGGSLSAILQMFDKVGGTPTHKGEIVEVEHSYAEGLTPAEYIAKQYYGRTASITKGVDTSKPGYCISRDSQVEVVESNVRSSVFWSDIEIGDQFEDGSVVEEIWEWQEKECVMIAVKDALPIVISYDHLVLADIILNGSRLKNLEASKSARDKIGETDDHWVCAQDIFYMYKMGAKILLSTEYDVEYVKYVGVKEVRCISTNTGFYETNGMVHHNSIAKDQMVVVYREEV